MKLTITPTPSKENPKTILIRHIPETPADEKAIKLMSELLAGSNVIYTVAAVGKKQCGSILATQNSKRAGSK